MAPLLAQRHEPICSMPPELGFHCTSFTKSVLWPAHRLPDRAQAHGHRADSILRENSWMATPRWPRSPPAGSRRRHRPASGRGAAQASRGPPSGGDGTARRTCHWPPSNADRLGRDSPALAARRPRPQLRNRQVGWRSPHRPFLVKGHPLAGCHPAMHRQRAERGAGAHRDRHHRQRLPSIPGRQQLQLGRSSGGTRGFWPPVPSLRASAKGGRSAAGRSADTFLSCVTAMHWDKESAVLPPKLVLRPASKASRAESRRMWKSPFILGEEGAVPAITLLSETDLRACVALDLDSIACVEHAFARWPPKAVEMPPILRSRHP